MADLILDMPAAEYHAAEGLNSSTLKYLHEGPPARFKYALDNPPEETKGMIFGRAVHSIVLEGPEKFGKEFVFEPGCDKRTKFGKVQFAAFMEQAGCRTVLSEAWLEDLNGIRAAVETNPVKDLTPFTVREASCFWDDDKFECRCKARIDAVDPEKNVILDLKTTGKSIRDFYRSALSLDYPLQAGFYARAWKRVTGAEKVKFMWLVVETKPPYLVAAITLEQGDLDAIEEKIDALADTYVYYTENEFWPINTPDSLFIPQWWWEKGEKAS